MPSCAARDCGRHARGLERASPRFRLLAPLGQDLAEWRMRAGRPDPKLLVFAGHDGGLWWAATYKNWRRRIVGPAAAAAGLTASLPHDLRHSFVS